VNAELWSGFRLGDRLVRPEVNKIDDTRIDAKAMEVLVALAEVAPSVVSASALLERVWPKLVVVDNVVYQAIAQLRKALGDTARSPRYIECVARRGYRLVAPIGAEANGAGESLEKRHNLPEDLTSFIGRERETNELIELLKHRRMITLTGVGGCGKTRLALSLARASIESFPDGVWLVDLAPLSDASQVIHAIAKSLQLRERQGRYSLQELIVGSLTSAQTLLLFDNCEHVIDSTARIMESLLKQTSGLKILATSREGLGIAPEQAWPVQPLAIPTDDETSSVERLANVDSVRLFLERANVVDLGFMLSDENAEAVAEICKRLDGLPFAIELAAARLRDMNPEQIRSKLHDRFRLLAGGGRTALPRQRTLQATLDWSHQLMSEAERRLLRRLSVFVVDFPIEAATSLSTSIEREQTLELLTRLVDQSMVRVDSENGRYRMLETVRQYANDRLSESGEIALIRDRHRDFYVALAETLCNDVEAGNWRSNVFQRFLADQDNFDGALTWCLETNFELGVHLARKLSWFWLRLNITSAFHWFADLLEKAPDSFPERSELLRFAALFHLDGDPTRAIQCLEQALQTAGAVGAPAWSEAAACISLAGVLLLSGGEVDKSDVLLKRAALAAEATDPRLRALLSVESAEVMTWIRFADAQVILEESALVLRRVGDQDGLSRTLSMAGRLNLIKGDFVKARATLTEAVALSRTVGNHLQANSNMAMLGLLAEVAGDNVEATRLTEACERSFTRVDRERHVVRASLGRLLWKIGQRERGVEMLHSVLRAACNVVQLNDRFANPSGMLAVHSMANIACDLGEHIRAARLYGAARKMSEVAVRLPQDLSGALFDGVVNVLRASLGEKAFDVECAAGASMTYEQAIDFALAETRSPQDGSLATVHRLSSASTLRSG